MDTFILIIGVIGSVLNIILFFKLWNACDNINRIAKKLTESDKQTPTIAKPLSEKANFEVQMARMRHL